MKTYNWNSKATKHDIELYLASLRDGIRFYMRQDNDDKVKELQAEIESIKEFYGIK
jgi:hypothetical protein